MQTTRSFVGMDVHKASISTSVAEGGRRGPVRFIGVIPNTPEAVGKMRSSSPSMVSWTSAMKPVAVAITSIASSQALGTGAPWPHRR